MKLLKNKKLHIVIASTFIIGLLAHAFVFANYNFSSDALIATYSNDMLWKISLGRFMQPLSMFITGNVHTSWLSGIISLVYISCAAYLIVDLFKIKKKSLIVLISGILVTNVSFTLTNASYMHETNSFMLALLLSVIAVYIFEKHKLSFLISSVLLMMSMGFYQAYIQVALTLFILIIILKILKDIEFKKILKYIGKIVITFLIAGILYYMTHKLTMSIFGVTEVMSYNTVTNVYSIFDVKIFRNIYDSIINTYYIYFHGPSSLGLLNTVLYVATTVLLIIILGKKVWVNKLSKQKIILLISAFICLVGSLNVIYILTGGLVHYLMTYVMCLPTIFLIFLFEKEENKNIINIGKIVVILIIYSNIIYANQVYLKKELDYHSTQEIYSRIISDIEEIEGYIPKSTEVIFIGDINDNPNYEKNTNFDHLNETGVGDTFTLSYTETYSMYNENIINSPLKIVKTKDYDNNQEIMDMSIYPSKNSIKLIDNRIIVKLS